MLSLLLPTLLAVGCGTVAHPEQRIQETGETVPSPEATTALKPLESKDASPQNKIAVVDEKNSIFFSLGSSSISLPEKNKLRDTAEQLTNSKTTYVTLIGLANDNGSRSFDLAVADARVEAVAGALKKLGVKPHQIKKKVIGSENIPAACRSAECRRKMRRVDLVISSAH